MCALRVELVAHSQIKRAGKHGQTLVLGMPMRRDLVPGGRLESDDEGSCLPGVALQHRDLRALGHRRWCVGPFDFFRVGENLRVTRPLSQRRARDHRAGDEAENTFFVDRRFHRIAPFMKERREDTACENRHGGAVGCDSTSTQQ